MNVFKEEKNRGYIIAGIGGIVGVIAFYLPFVTYTSTTSGTSITAASSQSYSVGGAFFGLISVSFLITTLVVAIAAILLLSPSPFGATNLSQEKQLQYGNYAIVGGGALVLLFHIIFAFGDHGFTLFGSTISSATTGISTSLSIGFWLFLLASLAMIAGGVLALRPNLLSRGAGAGAYQQPYQQPYQPPYTTADQQPYAYPPVDQQPYSSYQGQYPPQQGYPQQYPQQGNQQQFAPTEMSQQNYQQQPYQQPTPQQQFAPTERAQQPQYPPPQPQQPQQPPQQQPPQQQPQPPQQPGW